MAQKKTLADITGPRYRKAEKTQKSTILDEFCHTTGYNRKYAVTLLRRAGKNHLRRIDSKTLKVKITAQRRKKRLCHRIYDDPVEKAVHAIWDFFYRICDKRLVSMIRTNLKALIAEFNLPQNVQAKLAQVSRSTIERMLGRERKRHKAKGTSSTKPGTLLKQQISVRTFWHWEDKKAGFCEIDTVSHDGGRLELMAKKATGAEFGSEHAIGSLKNSTEKTCSKYTSSRSKEINLRMTNGWRFRDYPE
jgi:hypothetical protein